MNTETKELLELADRDMESGDSFMKYAASLVEYNPVTGSMVWKAKNSSDKDAARWNARYSGKEAGTIDDKGYKRILLRSFGEKVRRVRVHQLAWFIVSGRVQSGEIDHINQNKLDNRAENLRDVEKSVNQRNCPMQKNNTSGVTGVSWNKTKQKWEASVGVDGKLVYLGLHKKICSAKKAVIDFRSANGFTEIHGAARAMASLRVVAEIGRRMESGK